MNITEYTEKYSGVTLDKMPLNCVDSLVLSQLSYLKFEGIPELYAKKDGISLKEIAKSKYVKNLYLDERYASDNTALFNAVASSKRFGNILMKDFVNIIDDDWQIQFSAMTFVFDNNTTYIAFRGTDDNLVGWQENLGMIYNTPIPAQKEAVKYLRNVSKKIKGDFYIGGHSKGGNLAVYSSMNVNKAIQSRIICIFSHDGPGFIPKVIENSNFENIKHKINKTVPKSSIVGMLMTTVENYEVVVCNKIGMSQHYPFNWVIEENDFKHADKIDKSYYLKDKAVNLWALNLTPSQVEYLSTEIFGIFDKAGITNLNDIQSNLTGLLSSIRNLISTMNEIDEETKKKMDDIFKNLSDIFIDVMKEDVNTTLENARLVVDNVIENVKAKETSKHKGSKVAVKKVTARKKDNDKAEQ